MKTCRIPYENACRTGVRILPDKNGFTWKYTIIISEIFLMYFGEIYDKTGYKNIFHNSFC